MPCKTEMAEEFFYCHPTLRTLPNSGSHTNLSRCRATTYPGDVTESDISDMSLAAQCCKKVNERVLRKQCEGVPDGCFSSLRCNSSFLVKSENSHLYCAGVKTPVPLQLLPGPVCPNQDKHLHLVGDLPLAVACPTCWSWQRIPPVKSPGSLLAQDSSRTSLT